MKFSPRWRVAAALMVLALGALIALQPGRKAAGSSPSVRSSEGRRIEPEKPEVSLRENSPVAVVTESPAATASTMESIEAAESPAALAPYLSSGVPEVRAAAVDAMIRFGDSAAVPLLESAARTLSTDDAAPLLEAARFLALPDASGFIAGKAPTPAPSEGGGRKPSGIGSRKRDTQPAIPQGGDQAPSR